MKASQLTAVVLALVLALMCASIKPAHADVPDSPEISGTVQDWRVDPGYMVVGGVRYEFGPDFVLLTDRGQPLPSDIVVVGDKVRFRSYDGVVETVVLVREGTQR